MQHLMLSTEYWCMLGITTSMRQHRTRLRLQQWCCCAVTVQYMAVGPQSMGNCPTSSSQLGPLAQSQPSLMTWTQTLTPPGRHATRSRCPPSSTCSSCSSRVASLPWYHPWWQEAMAQHCSLEPPMSCQTTGTPASLTGQLAGQSRHCFQSVAACHDLHL